MTPDHIQAVVQLVVSILFNSLPEGFLVALFAWATLHLAPRQNSRTRFAVWFLALLAVAGIPLFGALMPGGLSLGRLLAASGATGVLPHPFAPAGLSTAISLPAHWAPYILFIWLSAALAIMTRLAVGLWRLRQLRQSCVEVEAADLDPAVASNVAELSSAAPLAGRPVTIATSQRVRVPAALGLWKPMIVLPTWTLLELPPSDLSIILRHEFAHLQRWDDWTNLVQKIVRALFFFHPAVWWIEKRLSVEREMACDDVVVAQTDNPTGYASCLVSLLERSLTERGWTMAQALVHRAREASLRLKQILDRNRPTATRLSKPALGMVGAFTLLCLIVLPHTPQVVAFKQSPQSIAANHAYSATLAQPAIPGSSFVQQANVRTSPSAKAFAASLKAPALHAPQANSTSISAHAALPPSASTTASSWPVRQRETSNDSTVASSPDTFVEVNFAFADQNNSSALPTVVFVQTIKYLEPDSATHQLVWRIEVWRVTVVNSVWGHAMRTPVAHST